MDYMLKDGLYGNMFYVDTKREFFQAVTVSLLFYGYTTWNLMKRLQNKFGWNYTMILEAAFH